MSLQDPKVLRRIWEKKDTQQDDAAQGWPCGQVGSLQRETLQTTHPEQGAWGQAALQPSICSFFLRFNSALMLVLPRIQAPSSTGA